MSLFERLGFSAAISEALRFWRGDLRVFGGPNAGVGDFPVMEGDVVLVLAVTMALEVLRVMMILEPKVILIVTVFLVL